MTAVNDATREGNISRSGCENREPRKVFIIGAARSGTKLLRDVIATSQFVTAIPFDINYVWRFGNEWRNDDRIPENEASQVNRKYINDTLHSLVKRASGRRSSILLEKTVSNVFRIPYIHKLFPEALFIHLVRDGRDVAESATRMWKAPISITYMLRKLRYFPIRNLRYAMVYVMNSLKRVGNTNAGGKSWGPRYAGIDDDAKKLSVLEVAARQWAESIKAAKDGLSSVPADRWISITYEKFVFDSSVLEGVLDFIGVSDQKSVMESYKKMVKNDRIGTWRNLSVHEQDLITQIQLDELTSCGYVVEEDGRD